MEFITLYVLPPIVLGFVVALGIIGVQKLKQRMSGNKSVENERVCANGHPKSGNRKFCAKCGQQ